MRTIYGHDGLNSLIAEDASVELLIEEVRLLSEIDREMLSEANLKDKFGVVIQKINDFIKKIGEFLAKLLKQINHSINQGTFTITDKIKGVVGGKKMLHVKYVQADILDANKIGDILTRVERKTYWVESRVKALANGNRDTEEIIKEAIEHTEEVKEINADIAKAKDTFKDYRRENMSSEFALRYLEDMDRTIKNCASYTVTLEHNKKLFDSMIKSIEIRQKQLEKETPVNDEEYLDIGKRMSTAIDLAKHAVTMYNGASVLVAQFSKNFLSSKMAVQNALTAAANDGAEPQPA